MNRCATCKHFPADRIHDIEDVDGNVVCTMGVCRRIQPDCDYTVYINDSPGNAELSVSAEFGCVLHELIKELP